jgi:CDP-diacylglycerol--glycerol-3-phosphate 3-phosphatidyltransferase
MPERVLLSDMDKERFRLLVEPLANGLSRMGVSPNALSCAGVALSGLSGWIYGTGSFFLGALVAALAGICDTLDGQIARAAGKESAFGAFLDSTLDRFGELLIFLGLAWHFSGGSDSDARSPWAVIFILLSVGGSFLVSYTRARAEGLGIECKVGWMQRPERLVLLIAGSLLGAIPAIGWIFMMLTLFLLAVSSNLTALQRILHIRRRLGEEGEKVRR